MPPIRVSLPEMLASIVSELPRHRRDYYRFWLDEVLRHLRETIAGEQTLAEFAEHYCLATAPASGDTNQRPEEERADG